MQALTTGYLSTLFGPHCGCQKIVELEMALTCIKGNRDCVSESFPSCPQFNSEETPGLQLTQICIGWSVLGTLQDRYLLPCILHAWVYAYHHSHAGFLILSVNEEAQRLVENDYGPQSMPDKVVSSGGWHVVDGF